MNKQDNIDALVSKYRGYKLPGGPETVHTVPCSGGADSSALCVLLRLLFPEKKFEYIFTDTGADDPAVYESLNRLEEFLGISIERVKGDHTLFTLIEKWKGYLPSPRDRWCTPGLKLRPFEEWMKKFAGKDMAMYIGIRADETTRVAFALDDVETMMPFVDLKLKREDVYAILTASVGIPDLYRYRTRSGCSCCPYQSRAERVGLMIERPIEFHRGGSLEKLNDVDKDRHAPANPLTVDTGWSLNHLGLPMPKVTDKITGKLKRKSANLFGTKGVFIGAEFFEDAMPGDGAFVWHQRIVSHSPSLHGIKQQLNSRYAHLLGVPEVYDMDVWDIRNRTRFAIYYLEMDGERFDPEGPTAGSYTWHQGESYRMTEHIISWASRTLHAATLQRDAKRVGTLNELTWSYEHARSSKEALDRIRDHIGSVVSMCLYKPVEPKEDDEIDEKTVPCPYCHI